MQAVATAVATARPSTPPPSAAVAAVVPLVITPPSSEWGAMTVVQLKDELRSRGLRLGGKKAELVERLSGATAAEAVATRERDGPEQQLEADRAGVVLGRGRWPFDCCCRVFTIGALLVRWSGGSRRCLLLVGIYRRRALLH